MKINIKFLSIIFTVIILASCNKESENNISNQVVAENIIQEKFTAEDFKIFGEVHNAGLDYMANDPNLSSLTPLERYDLSKSYVYKDWISTNQISFDSLEYYLSYLNEIFNDPRSVASTMVNDGYLSPTVENYFNQINSVFIYVISQSELGIEVKSSEVNDLISQIENDIISDGIKYESTTATGDWNACMMEACSVAKSSYLYWYNAAIDTDNPWNFEVSGYSTKSPDWWKKLIGRVKDDVVVTVISYSLMRGDAGLGVLYSLGHALGSGISASGH